MPKKRGKRYVEAREKTPEGRLSLDEAVTALKQLPSGKFDSTIELSMHLGIDPRQADQALRGSVSLPHGIGKTRKVIAFCEGEDVDKAKAAGAIEAGSDELIQKIQDGWTDFDVAISTPQMMKNVSRLGRVLGPQGKMPSPKSGTIVQDNIDEAVKEFAAGKVEYRNDSGGNLHVPIGKWSFSEEQIRENAASFIRMVKRLRPTTTKGTYIKKICISGTMTPSVEIDAMSVST